jgi:hypothetical protein
MCIAVDINAVELENVKGLYDFAELLSKKLHVYEACYNISGNSKSSDLVHVVVTSSLLGIERLKEIRVREYKLL